MSVVRLTRIKYDSALGIVLSTFFGFGLVLHTLIQRTGNANQAGLDTFSLRASRHNSGERYFDNRCPRWCCDRRHICLLERIEVARF